jgi:dynein heavy chain
VPAVAEIGVLCDELRETQAITINPLVTHTLDDFKHKQDTQLTQVAVPAMEAAQEKARKILERVVRDVADEAKAVSAAVAATGGIDSFVSKTKSMVALKRERHERARAHKRVEEERQMLPALVRLADYMLTEALVAMANANARRLLDVVERPDPKSKGALSVCVAFASRDQTVFEPDERSTLLTVNETVLDGVARAVGAAPRVAFARAFQPLLEAAARVTEVSVEGDTDTHRVSVSRVVAESGSESGALPSAPARTPAKNSGLGPMAVLLADATWLSMRASLDAKIAASFADAREYVKTYEDLRPIHAFGASWDREAYEKAPRSVAAFRADMLVQRGWARDLDKMKTSATAGCVFVDGKPLRAELVSTVHGMLESMKALLLVKAREEAIKAGSNFAKRAKTLAPRPEDLDGFMSLVEQHQRHAAAKAAYVAEHATVEEMFAMLVEYEMKIPAADQVRLDDLNEARAAFAEAMRSAGEYVESKKAEMMKALKTGVADVEEALFREQTSLNTGMYMDRESDPAEVVRALAAVRATLDAHAAKCDLYKRYQKLFGVAVGAFSSLDLAAKEYDQKHDSWDALFRFRSDSQSWMSNACETLELDAITNGVDDAYTAAYKMLKLRRDDQVVMRTREEIEAFRKYVPLLNEVANPALQPRHWEKIFAVFEKGAYDPEKPPTASDLLEWGALDRLEQLENIGANASKEYSLAQTLKKMTKEWEGQEFRCIPYKDSGTYVLGGSDDAQALLDDQIVKAQGMCASPFVKPFEADAKAWSATLNTLQDMLDNWLKCQQTWLYLEPIFSSEDIVKQMPEEGEKFRQVDNEWRDIMNATKEAPDVIEIGKDKERLDRLEECNILLDAIQKGLSAYLEKKRLFFPRFFFLSNDEMLEILSETKDPTRVQPHLKKCFEGVAKLKFEGEDFLITAMISEEQEEVPLMNPIPVADANGAVEKWLLQTEAAMFDSIHNVTGEGLKAYTAKPRDQWVLDWPGMVVLVCTAVNWTADVTRAIGEGKGAVKAYEEKCTADLLKIVDRVRGELTSLQRKTLGALVVMDVHARDVVSVLAKNGVASASDFDWQAQLRSYWEEDPREERDLTAIMRIMNAEVEYGYEYLGNSSRLVITPLTDRCYRTLMGAIHLTMGGAPEGPAGTGKTETTKDLAKALARQCVVFNCSDSMDYIQMGKFFKGLASSGAWACFDEFNRIDLEVLSVVAQQVLDIQRAISAKVTSFVFEGTEIGLKYSAWCSITMNPGYAGRSELPDNLKALFRTVAMMVPDYAMIGEIILYSFGYLEARDCATKIVQCYKLCSEQLSSQDHYDYGMRAVMAVLRAAGNLKRRYPEDDEYELMLRSIIDVNLCKFLSHDVPLFKGIISDLFPRRGAPESGLRADGNRHARGVRRDEPATRPVLLPEDDPAVRDDRRAARADDRRAAVFGQDAVVPRLGARAVADGGARRGGPGEVRVQSGEPEGDHDGAALRAERPADARVAGRRLGRRVPRLRAGPKPEPQVGGAGRPRGRDLDREHEHRAGRQQEAVPELGRDHRHVLVHEHDLRGCGFSGGVAGYRLAMRHGIPGAAPARVAPAVRLVAGGVPRALRQKVPGPRHGALRLAPARVHPVLAPRDEGGGGDHRGGHERRRDADAHVPRAARGAARGRPQGDHQGAEEGDGDTHRRDVRVRAHLVRGRLRGLQRAPRGVRRLPTRGVRVPPGGRVRRALGGKVRSARRHSRGARHGEHAAPPRRAPGARARALERRGRERGREPDTFRASFRARRERGRLGDEEGDGVRLQMGHGH